MRDKAPTSASTSTSTSMSAEQYIREALSILGIECDTGHPSTARTPERFVKYLREFMQPSNLEELMGEGFDAVHDKSTILGGIVTQSGIPFRAICEHHLLPMLGVAHVGYIPRSKVFGVSKLTRLVEAIGTEKPSIQEAITERIADILYNHLDSVGSIAVINATHSCMSCRGVAAPSVITSTSCVRGAFRDVQSARQEFFDLVRSAYQSRAAST
jgi:GTP cyclohydrolase IA